MDKPVLVIGATGFLGAPVARHLLERGYPVRVMSRSHDRAQEAFGDVVEIAVGDALNTADLEPALAGCAGVHISVESAQEDTCVQNIVSVASGQGLERLSYVSGSTVFEENAWFPLVAGKLRAEKAIRESGIPYCIFCPTWFMDMLPRFVRAGRASLLGQQPHPAHFVAVDDFARMVAASYGLEEAATKRFFIHGPEAFTVREGLERYIAALHPDIEKVSAMPLWMARLMALVTRSEPLKYAANLMGYFEKTAQGGDPAEANRILGAPTITFDEWLEKRKSEAST